MTRTQRLFELIQILRRHRYPITAAKLAAELNISVRSIYRDIESLKAQGADIEGEPGLGYVLRPSFMLPPLMFTDEELEALVLGSRWVAKNTDQALSLAANNALAKIAAVLPEDLRLQLQLSSLLIGPTDSVITDDQLLTTVRAAIRFEHKLKINYCALDGKTSVRKIWPIGLGFFNQVKIIIAWCELRQDFRHFRADRVTVLTSTQERYPQRKHQLMQRWRESNKIPPQ